MPLDFEELRIRVRCGRDGVLLCRPGGGLGGHRPPGHPPIRHIDGLAQLSGGGAALWVGCRVIGAVITVPVAEELAFRGYMMRKLIASEFATVRLGQFTWHSFLLSSLLFGVLHGRWLAGTLAGMGYALVLARRGHLADAVLAHMTTNTLLAAYVLSYRAWALWA